MDNNKNLRKTHDHSNAELRKMFPKGGEDIGMQNGVNINEENKQKYTKRSKLSHNK